MFACIVNLPAASEYPYLIRILVGLCYKSKMVLGVADLVVLGFVIEFVEYEDLLAIFLHAIASEAVYDEVVLIWIVP